MKSATRHLLALAVTAIGASAGLSAQATTLKITVTNTQAEGGLSITPLYTAFHDGSFDAFDLGGMASPGIELIAETGMPGTVAAERRAVDPDSQPLVLASPSGPPPIQPGEIVTDTIDVTATGPLFFTFLSMLLPSNDHFIGNDNPLAYQIFDDSGNFTGDRTISVTGAQIYDAGTEANGLEGAAFIQGVDIADSPAGEGSIQQGIPLSNELVAPGVLLATGDTLDPALIDFTTDPAAFGLLTIQISEVAPVPLPASAPLLLGALGFLGWRHRRKAHR
ncbi:spondin domain-containing protein [Roseobacter sinensis]|uniref:Spondin domain-containing protein n=1 Tax=Roseobacter sinensis TaxID=2931391 RepID=A0ABT3BDW4_9RHOB|nr:spondin domain-containing protein [Roseobacter sp. WL0113]MCV3271766.1 spondin domain-containing protein [Roseobacter sp. WL0113]